MSFSKVSLREAFWFQEGPGVRKWQFTTSGIKLLNVANIVKDGSINLSKTDHHLSEEEVDSKYSHFLADPGDLVIASSGISIDDDGFLRTRGAFVDKCHLPLCMNTSTIRFKSLNGVSELAYLRHWLQSFEFRSQITREVTGIAQKNFGPSHLKRLRISLPPLAEQKRIAGILDAADALRAKRREALAQLDTLIQSTFLDMFGDPVTNPMGLPRETLKSAFEFTTGKLDSNAAVEGGKYPFFTCARETSAIDDYAFDCEALLLAGNNANADYSVKHYKGRFNAYQRTYVITINESALTYAYARLALEYLLGDLKRFSKGTNTKYLTMVILNRMPIHLPPLDLQLRFAAVVESIEGQKARQRAYLAELDTLFASLQSRAFRGDL